VQTGRSVLVLASEVGEPAVLRALLRSKRVDVNGAVSGVGQSALYVAVEAGNVALAKALIAAGANVHVVQPKVRPAVVVSWVGDAELHISASVVRARVGWCGEAAGRYETVPVLLSIAPHCCVYRNMCPPWHRPLPLPSPIHYSQPHPSYTIHSLISH
jgi:hypothetical protein